MVSEVARMTRAERKAQTREELLDAALRLFCGSGFHGTSLDQVAAAAGYTKGAVYSNFSSKEDLFFAVYERRVEHETARLRELLEHASPADVAKALVARRRGGVDDGWLAVFFEFWAHALRHPELRERFERVHRAARAPMVAATERWFGPSVDAESWTLAAAAMVTGLSLEQLTDPQIDGAEIAGRMLETMMRGSRS